MRIAINGFGRIGRTLFRQLSQRSDLQIVAINDLAPADKLAYLTQYDTVMGTFTGAVTLKKDRLHAGKQQMQVLHSSAPNQLPWKALAIDVVVEATGRFTTREGCEKHLQAGAKRVLLTVPAKDEIDVTIVCGVNDQDLKAEHRIISNASCTTNCLAPIAKVLHENFGIEKGFMTTIHAYTNDQRLFDYAHKDLRRARAANDNIIPTTTGAAKAVGKVIPELNGRLDGMAMRVPVANGSTIDLVACLSKPATVDSIHQAMQQAAQDKMKGIIEYCTAPIVSRDIMQNAHSAIFDSLSTSVMNKRFAKLFAWYDNEWGYSARLVNVLERLQQFP